MKTTRPQYKIDYAPLSLEEKKLLVEREYVTMVNRFRNSAFWYGFAVGLLTMQWVYTIVGLFQ